MGKVVSLILFVWVITLVIAGCSNKVHDSSNSIEKIYQLGNKPDGFIYYKLILKQNGDCVWYKKYDGNSRTSYGKWFMKDSVIYADFPAIDLIKFLKSPGVSVAGRHKFLFYEDSIEYVEANDEVIELPETYMFYKIK